jgi:hypothetical protein
MLVLAVSRSRISPIITTSGSALRMLLRPEANVRPTFGLTCTWLMPGIRYSIGFSTVIMFFSGEFSSYSVA